jgi:hypothetical protein
MKRINNKLFPVLIVLFSVFGYIVSCTHDDLVPPSTGGKITRGTNVHLPGLTVGNPDEWKFDKTHCSVLWTTNYVGASGLLTGRFNHFGVHDVTPAKMIMYSYSNGSYVAPLPDTSWAFYENEPSKTYFNGYVQINTSNTGEPGRDAGCNVSGMGTVAIVANQYNLTETNLAKIKTTEVKFDPASSAYIVTLTMTWKGKLAAPLTKSYVGKLTYIPLATIVNGTSSYKVFGLQLKFSFNCRDFGIDSKSISDKIDIEVNANFHNK